VNEQNIAAVKRLVDENRHITYQTNSDTLSLHYPSIKTILHEKLGLRKISARWVPHKLTDEQKRKRVEFCQTNLADFGENGRKRLTDIVTGDETWIYFYTTPDK